MISLSKIKLHKCKGSKDIQVGKTRVQSGSLCLALRKYWLRHYLVLVTHLQSTKPSQSPGNLWPSCIFFLVPPSLPVLPFAFFDHMDKQGCKPLSRSHTEFQASMHLQLLLSTPLGISSWVTLEKISFLLVAHKPWANYMCGLCSHFFVVLLLQPSQRNL